MTITFNDVDYGSTIQLEQINENSLSITINDCSSIIRNEVVTSTIVIDNQRLFKLLGALHHIQKDMPRYDYKKI